MTTQNDHEVKMDDLALGGAFAMTYENTSLGHEDFPRNELPVVILGRVYSTLCDYEELKDDILSRIWITYRKGFTPIGGDGPTTDTGWGCMLRCGQMMLAQALMNNNIHSDWRWNKDSLRKTPAYKCVLEMFADMKKSCYSIHQIASMGVAEGKDIGQWFGPNTIAQVLKKLSSFDGWNKMIVHVAMDNTIVINDIKTLCSTIHSSSGVNLQFEDTTELGPSSSTSVNVSSDGHGWRPLLLMVPLRLGLSNINDVYIESLKKCFQLTQSVGVIGGKPNHAHWFIGYVGDELVFLDPHTTQYIVDMSHADYTDMSYHCPMASRMKITNLDPSIALGFFCKTENEFDDLCQSLTSERNSLSPMFEICQSRPSHWPPLKSANAMGTDTVFTVVPSPKYDTDEEYELV